MKWISVKDELPSPEQIVVISGHIDKFVCIAKLKQKKLSSENWITEDNKPIKPQEVYSLSWECHCSGKTIEFDKIDHWFPI